MVILYITKIPTFAKVGIFVNRTGDALGGAGSKRGRFCGEVYAFPRRCLCLAAAVDTPRLGNVRLERYRYPPPGGPLGRPWRTPDTDAGGSGDAGVVACTDDSRLDGGVVPHVYAAAARPACRCVGSVAVGSRNRRYRVVRVAVLAPGQPGP